jgi:hypothetical protein
MWMPTMSVCIGVLDRSDSFRSDYSTVRGSKGRGSKGKEVKWK